MERRNLHESCGVVGVFAPNEDVARLTFFSLFALQHRGQESSGIATADGKKLRAYARMGLVSQVFNEEALSQLTGHIAIGHNRYSTKGSSRLTNAQPIVVSKGASTIAIAHNGNIVNAESLHEELAEQGYIFHTSTDTEVIAHLYEEHGPGFLKHLRGMFAIARWDARKQQLLLARDRLGKKPLCYAQTSKYLIFSSELKAILENPEVRREVAPEAIDY